ncbi:MAG TPA: universal stress protein [Acidimicrobiales bacterium]|nr:universal stress protein [Acidimicrobiales bacterium]
MTSERPRVVVGVDGSPSATAALEWAARYAELTGAEVEAVTCWHWPRAFGFPLQLADHTDPCKDAETVLAGVLERFKAEHGATSVTAHVVQGPAGPALAQWAKGAALLVVGSRGHGQLAEMLLGSVGQFCTAHASCPVVVVR